LPLTKTVGVALIDGPPLISAATSASCVPFRTHDSNVALAMPAALPIPISRSIVYAAGSSVEDWFEKSQS
jgi:hypothetical protein